MKLRSIVTLVVVIFLLCCMILGGYVFFVLVKNTSSHTMQFSSIGTIGNATISLNIAKTESALKLGLSGKKALLQNQGMLFVLRRPGSYGVWMKDMLFPIDVLWLDQFGRVVTVKEHFLPTSYPEIAYPSTQASMVLEVSDGFVQGHEIHIGDKLNFSQNIP